jgi:hypothetical protein
MSFIYSFENVCAWRVVLVCQGCVSVHTKPSISVLENEVNNLGHCLSSGPRERKAAITSMFENVVVWLQFWM